MAVFGRLLHVCLLTSAASAMLVAPLDAQVGSSGLQIAIDNFGRAGENYYRGEQPDPEDYPQLAALGVRLVIDLTRDGQEDERRLVQQAGMKFARIPMVASERPSDNAVSE